MPRLFWTFPDGLPGTGLLMMRIATAAALLVRCVGMWWDAPSIEVWVLSILYPALPAFFLLAGFFTPAAAALITGVELWRTASRTDDPWVHVLVGTLGAALTLLGPGAWSVDASLFGWRRIDVPDRRTGRDGL